MTETRAHRPAPAAGSTPAAGAGRRRGPADPVLALMHRHYELCAGAVDPLEIAAGLEAHGITDRVAARFRHRDVFTLAEELYARVPRQPSSDGAGPPPGDDASTWRRTALHLLPALACAAGVTAAHLLRTPGPLALGAIVLAVVVLTVRAAVRSGPLRAAGARGQALATCWLLAFALYGPQALTALLGGPGGPRGLLDPQAAAGFLARAFALPPAAWLARRFARRARGRLADSAGLAAFRSGVRPLLAGTLALFALTLLALVAAAYAVLAPGALWTDPVAPAGAAALGLLFFTAQLLAVHGRRTAAVLGTGAACAVEALALAAAAVRPAAGLPLALVQAAGPGAVQAAACAAAAAVLIGHALRTLTRTTSHAPAHPADRAPYDPAYAAALFASPHAYATGAGER